MNFPDFKRPLEYQQIVDMLIKKKELEDLHTALAHHLAVLQFYKRVGESAERLVELGSSLQRADPDPASIDGCQPRPHSDPCDI
jgi:hypothetical protein